MALAIFSGLSSLCCALLVLGEWIGAHNITVELCSANTECQYCLDCAVFSQWWSDFTFHSLQRDRSNMESAEVLAETAFLARHSHDMRLKEPHKQCNCSCRTGPRPLLLKPLAKDSQICTKGGILTQSRCFYLWKWLGRGKSFCHYEGRWEIRAAKSTPAVLDIEKHLRNAQTTRQIFFDACIF